MSWSPKSNDVGYVSTQARAVKSMSWSPNDFLMWTRLLYQNSNDFGYVYTQPRAIKTISWSPNDFLMWTIFCYIQTQMTLGMSIHNHVLSKLFRGHPMTF